MAFHNRPIIPDGAPWTSNPIPPNAAPMDYDSGYGPDAHIGGIPTLNPVIRCEVWDDLAIEALNAELRAHFAGRPIILPMPMGTEARPVMLGYGLPETAKAELQRRRESEEKR